MSSYRHEYKYRISSCDEAVLLTVIGGIMQSDPNVGADGKYIIRSLYFDDVYDSFYYENMDGVDDRAKYRIRYYNNDTSFIRLEKKIKKRGMTRKVSCKLSKGAVENIISRKRFDNGELHQYGREERALLNEFSMLELNPKTIVTYERIPFVYSAGNVRVTFDRSITASSDVEMFLEGKYRQRPILPLGESILEVKWDEVLPLHIRDALSINNLDWSSFSKYSCCRKYNL